MKQIKKVLEKSLKDLNITIHSIEYKDKTLYIVLDSDETIDLDKVVEATNIINPILDEYDFIKEEYMLDVSSLEKGGNK